MKDKLLRKITKSILLVIPIISVIFLGKELLFSPTSINKFIATTIAGAPANNAFEDQKFYNCVIYAYNGTNNTSVPYTTNLTDDQLQSITSISCIARNVESLSGIEKITQLKELDVSYNALTSIDVSNNTALTKLHAPGNKLTSLDVSNNTALTELSASDNKLTSLDVSNNTALTKLDASTNRLTSLDVSNNTALTELDASYNKLTSLDLINNQELKKLDFSKTVVLNKKYNPLKNITLPQNIDTSSITWISSNESYAVVNSDNTITGLKKTEFLDIYDLYDIYVTGSISNAFEYNVYLNIVDEYCDFTDLNVDDDNNIVKDIMINTTLSDLKEKISTGGEVKVLNKNNTELEDTDVLGTGYKLQIIMESETEEYTLSVKGDITGNGSITVADVSKLYQYVRGKTTMDLCYQEAAKIIPNNDSITVANVAKLYQYVRKKINEL